VQFGHSAPISGSGTTLLLLIKAIYMSKEIRKILVADDDEDILDAVKMILLHNGYNVVTTVDGRKVKGLIN
jgi:PleD family two-component response regulator